MEPKIRKFNRTGASKRVDADRSKRHLPNRCNMCGCKINETSYKKGIRFCDLCRNRSDTVRFGDVHGEIGI